MIKFVDFKKSLGHCGYAGSIPVRGTKFLRNIMTVALMKYKGYTLRVIRNSCQSHPYEYVISPISEKEKLRIFTNCSKRGKHIKNLNCRSSHIKSPYWFRGYRATLYDPTSMPKSRGKCSAMDYGKSAIDNLIATNGNPTPSFFSDHPASYVWRVT